MACTPGAKNLAGMATILPSRDRTRPLDAAPSRCLRADRRGERERAYTPCHLNVLQGSDPRKDRILLLGSGGFGSVYLAEDTWIDKKVAIKVPHKQDVDFGDLVKEPRLLASMSHPNIVTVLTAEKQDDHFFIVMEYVPGETLEQLINREGALELAQALDFTCQMCNAVDHAHRAGVLHRDLRPGNMLVTESGILKVSDFGTSRFLEIAAHGTTVIGSPPYMAPEQFHGKAVFASDVYSIGITMYQMLTGELPYTTPAPADLDRLMRGELVTAPRLKNRKIPRHQRHRAAGARARAHRALRASGELLDDVLAAREPLRGASAGARRAAEHRRPVAEIQSRLKARETPTPRFCWHCRKPLHARTEAALSAERFSNRRRSPVPGSRFQVPGSGGAVPGSRFEVREVQGLELGTWTLEREASCYNVSKESLMAAFPETGKIWMNGSLVDWKDARIHVASHVVHYGSGVFEGARCYEPPSGRPASAWTRTSAG